MTIQKFADFFRNILPPEDIFILTAAALDRPKVFILAHPEYELTDDELSRATSFLDRRATHEPVAYILGHKEFYGRDFIVTRDTLVPRPETEHIVELALNEVESRMKNEKSSDRKKILIADIGTGSGNIIISLATEVKRSESKIEDRKLKTSLHATDISDGALDIAKKNAEQHNVADMISFSVGNLLEPLADTIAEYDNVLITANLPYLSESIYASADPDVQNFEPVSALVSGTDGLDHYRALFAQFATLPKQPEHFVFFCEISPEQAPLIPDLIHQYFPSLKPEIYTDLAGLSRIVVIRQ